METPTLGEHTSPTRDFSNRFLGNVAGWCEVKEAPAAFLSSPWANDFENTDGGFSSRRLHLTCKRRRGFVDEGFFSEAITWKWQPGCSNGCRVKIGVATSGQQHLIL
ncbi:hypothetical protein Zmor_025360 [Zophobas morio]|uniref:Uncharacterized protein n=1 Tax=Zophobas morio TaxID=2755281 RepID=A0AA38HT79_9CUCU|nr:hypothetical protein Zmor_025360 [Zophobas morio]